MQCHLRYTTKYLDSQVLYQTITPSSFNLSDMVVQAENIIYNDIDNIYDGFLISNDENNNAIIKLYKLPYDLIILYSAKKFNNNSGYGKFKKYNIKQKNIIFTILQNKSTTSTATTPTINLANRPFRLNFENDSFMANHLYMNFTSISDKEDIDKFYDWRDLNNNTCDYYKEQNICNNNSVTNTNNITIEHLRNNIDNQKNKSLSETNYVKTINNMSYKAFNNVNYMNQDTTQDTEIYSLYHKKTNKFLKSSKIKYQDSNFEYNDYIQLSSSQQFSTSNNDNLSKNPEHYFMFISPRYKHINFNKFNSNFNLTPGYLYNLGHKNY